MTRNIQKKKSILKPTLQLLIKNLFEHNIWENAAALAYYLLFALFPLLIFISNLLGLLNLNVTAITQFLQQFLPKDIVGLIVTYLNHISHTSSSSLLCFALIFSIWFPLRAAKGLMADVRLAYHLGKPSSPFLYAFRQLIYTIVFLIVIALTLLLSIFGKEVLSYLNNLLPDNTLRMPDYIIMIWQYIRFIPIGVLMFIALGTLYVVALDKKQPIKSLMPGIIISLILQQRCHPCVL